MKMFKSLTITVLTASLLAAPLVGFAADQKTDTKAKPYPLKTCVVSGEKLGGDMDPYVFVYKGQEIKLCCKDCLKDFNKAPAKYMKKIEEAEAKAKKQG
jgi:uroporphyrinogen-III decarboxylase